MLNILSAQTHTTEAGLTMTSREIAELTGKNHADVLRDIRNMLEVLKKDASIFAGIYKDAYGRDKACFNLPFGRAWGSGVRVPDPAWIRPQV